MLQPQRSSGGGLRRSHEQKNALKIHVTKKHVPRSAEVKEGLGVVKERDESNEPESAAFRAEGQSQSVRVGGSDSSCILHS